MEYRVEKDRGFKFIGYVLETSINNGENFREIPKFWDKIDEDGRWKQLLDHLDNMGVCGISYAFNPLTKTFKYMIGVNDSGYIEDGMKEVAFDPVDYAVFNAKGKMPMSLQNLIKEVSEWFPNSELKRGHGPEIEVYPDGDPKSDDYVCYYWVPIRK